MIDAVPTVLVVDDAVELRAVVRTRLELSGLFSVVGEASNGVEAVELAAQLQPDLVLLDVSMPVMDGLEALQPILARSPSTHVVMFTGFDERGLATRARRLGATALLEKSTSIETLPAELLAILERAGMQVGETVAAEIAPHPDDLSPQEILGEHLERFREVFEQAAIGMGTMTLTGRLVRTNAAMAQLVGVDVGDLVGAAYADLLADVAPGTLPDTIARMTEDDYDVVQLEHGLRDNPQRRAMSTFAAVRDARRRALYLFVQVQDVTGERAAQEALQQSEQRFRLLVEAVNDYAIFMLDPNGNVVSWNAGAERLKGYRAGEIIGRHFSLFYPPDKIAERHPEHELELAVRDGQYEEEGWRIRKDGSRFWASVLITAVHDSAGRHVGFAKVTRDVTERRVLLDRLSSAADEQAQFLAVTAHELRTPISVISGSTELLQHHWDELEPAERGELLDSMTENAARMRRLLDDLLTAARLEAGAVELQRDHARLLPIIETAVAAARRRTPTADVTVEVPPDIVVDGDIGRIAQMVDNLLVNSVVHGIAPVSVRVVTRGGRAEIRVSDSGPGVPVDFEPRLFERFMTLKQRTGGGLGLFIVRELARAHGGDAWYERDADDHRPTFVVALPLAGRQD